MMNMNGMGSMMGWMMGLGLLGWVLLVGFLVAIVVLLWRLASRLDHGGHDGGQGPGAPPPTQR